MFSPSVSLEKNVHPVFSRSRFGRSIRYSRRCIADTGGLKFIIIPQSWFFCLQEHEVWTHKRAQLRPLMLNSCENRFSFSCNGDCRPATWTMLNMCNQEQFSIFSLIFFTTEDEVKTFSYPPKSSFNVFVLFYWVTVLCFFFPLVNVKNNINHSKKWVLLQSQDLTLSMQPNTKGCVCFSWFAY